MNAGERQQVTEVVEALVEREGCEALRLSVSNDRNIQVTLDADDEPITMEVCTRVNRGIRRALEDEGLPADDYSVEVESPGARRILKTARHCERFVGERARLVLAEPTADGQSLIRGVIEGVVAATVRLKPDQGQAFELALDEIASANLDPKY